jgi:methyl-accepting chemotaxis protein
MKNIKIGFRLVCGFLVVSIISLAMGIYNINHLNGLASDINTLGSTSLPFTSNLGVISSEMNNIRAIIRTLLDEHMAEDIRLRQADTLSIARERYSNAISAIDKFQLSKSDQEKISTLKVSLADWRASNDDFFKLIEAKDFIKARNVAYNSNKDLQQKALNAINDIIDTQNRESAKLVVEADKHSKSATLWSTVMIVAGFCVSIALGLLLTRGITRPLNRAVAMADGLAQGNLSLRMSMHRKDEIGMLSRSLDSMADTLSKFNADIVQTAGKASSGFLRTSIDDAGFDGDYKNLIGSVNRWAKSMLMLIDKVPSPIMIRDADRNMRFLNAAGSLGAIDVERLQGLKCENHFKTEDCVNGLCACDVAFKSHKEEGSSTVAKPLPNVQLDISYKAIPFGDDAVFEFVTDLTEIMKIQRKVVEVASRADQVALNVASASEQISAQVEQSSRGAEEQAQRVSETATAMEEMNATVLEVAKNASQAADTADKAKRKAEEGSSVVKQVVQSIAEVQKNALELKDDMTNLGQQAQGIGQIMNVISDIADQTNLLALNAAIEAARAGEAGRGFAVVADEVRKLAEKTMTATKEVGDAIHGIQSGTQKNIANVEHTVDKIDSATALATKSGESLDDIVTLVEATTDQVRSIAAASEQQSAASEEINRSIDDINRISSETSDAMRQSSQAVSELANQSNTLSTIIEEMKSDGQAGRESAPARGGDRGTAPKTRLALN